MIQPILAYLFTGKFCTVPSSHCWGATYIRFGDRRVISAPNVHVSDFRSVALYRNYSASKQYRPNL